MRKKYTYLFALFTVLLLLLCNFEMYIYTDQLDDIEIDTNDIIHDHDNFGIILLITFFISFLMIINSLLYECISYRRKVGRSIL